ncbi:MAG: hypothetical protein QW374_04040 [Candidatus Bathyarchaeia archaeon]|nr:hypothetical protein [Candidatus Bathyarchaeota archaeon]
MDLSLRQAMYERIKRILLIVRLFDSMSRNSIFYHPVSHINMVPTILEVAEDSGGS